MRFISPFNMLWGGRIPHLGFEYKPVGGGVVQGEGAAAAPILAPTQAWAQNNSCFTFLPPTPSAPYHCLCPAPSHCNLLWPAPALLQPRAEYVVVLALTWTCKQLLQWRQLSPWPWCQAGATFVAGPGPEQPCVLCPRMKRAWSWPAKARARQWAGVGGGRDGQGEVGRCQGVKVLHERGKHQVG